MADRRISILHAPTSLGLEAPAPGRIPGAWRMAEALRAAGLHGALDAEYSGEVSSPAYSEGRDSEFGFLNPHAIREYTVRLAERLGALLSEDRFPLVLGGDCSILLGCCLALRRRGAHGLVFLDGHADLGTPETSRSGGVAGMDLAIVTGTGPDLLADIDGLRPYIQQRHAVQLGCRDRESVVVGSGRRVNGTEIVLLGLDDIRSVGSHAAARAALSRLSEATDDIWIHLDADVLDDDVMPAVDSPQPGGLSHRELVEILRLLLASGRVVGMNVTIYDPERDPTGTYGRAFAATIAASLAP